jgi:hypothetical protein
LCSIYYIMACYAAIRHKSFANLLRLRWVIFMIYLHQNDGVFNLFLLKDSSAKFHSRRPPFSIIFTLFCVTFSSARVQGSKLAQHRHRREGKLISFL